MSKLCIVESSAQFIKTVEKSKKLKKTMYSNHYSHLLNIVDVIIEIFQLSNFKCQ